MTRRERAIKRRRRFILSVLAVVLVLAVIIISVVSCNTNKKDSKTKTESSSETQSVLEALTSSEEDVSSAEDTSTDTDSSETTDKPDQKTDSSEVTVNNNPGSNLDKSYKNLMLVNGKNPLPDNYDSDIRKDLVEIEPELRNNNYVTKIHKSVYPYITAMVKAAQADGVNLKVWSPFRSYADQQVLFENQVQKAGGDEAKAATVVARPGTSEHNTGICADFNMADDAFEKTPMYKWMTENAENYGFILRYPKNKQSVTGVIYESWHWRFVGIDMAKKINASGLCLEEYLEQNNLKQEISVDNF